MIQLTRKHKRKHDILAIFDPNVSFVVYQKNT